MWEKSLEACCFPHLFPTGQKGQYDDRPVQIPVSGHRSSRLYSEDARFRQNSPYICHLLFESELSVVPYAVSHVMRTGVQFQNMSARDFGPDLEFGGWDTPSDFVSKV